MTEQKYYTAAEVANLMGDKWTRQRVHVELKRGTFAEPAESLKSGHKSPLWTMEQIEAERRKRGLSDEK